MFLKKANPAAPLASITKLIWATLFIFSGTKNRKPPPPHEKKQRETLCLIECLTEQNACYIYIDSTKILYGRLTTVCGEGQSVCQRPSPAQVTSKTRPGTHTVVTNTPWLKKTCKFDLAQNVAWRRCDTTLWWLLWNPETQQQPREDIQILDFSPDVVYKASQTQDVNIWSISAL